MGKRNEILELRSELKFLYRVAKSVHSLEMEKLLQEIVQIASEVTKSDACLVYILDKKNAQLVLRASQNPHPELMRKIKLNVGEGITGWVAESQQPVAISKNAGSDPRFKYFVSLPEDKFAAFLSVPIVNKLGVVGVINIQHQKPHEHSEMEINLLTAVGKLVGGAVDNARLVEETLELREALEIRKLVEKAKGILVRKKHLNESQAYRILQKQSMESRKSLKEIAEAIIIAEQIKLGD